MSETKTKNDSSTIEKSNENIDGFNNVYTREGVQGAAKATGFIVKSDPLITEPEARAIYRSNGFGSKIVDRPVGDMVRAGFDVIGDTDGVMNSFLRKLKTKKALKAALTWGKVFGGGIIVMGIDDGGNLEDPLDEDSIKSIDFLKVYDRYRTTWTTDDLYLDQEEAKFGEIQWYSISPIESNVEPFRVHESRVLRFDGPLADDQTLKTNNRWNESIYRKVWTELINVVSTFAASKDIMDDFITTVLKISNLQEMIAAGQDDLVKTRLNIIDLGKHVMNTIMLDEKENYEKSASSVAGLAKLLQEHQQGLAAVTDIPMVILMGRSPGGQNATGDADIRIYYDQISSDQDDDLFDPLMRLITLAMKAKEGPTGGQLHEDWFIEFNPLWQPTESEIVETRNKQADTDIKYVQNGILLPAEVSESRFGGDEYSIETEIDDNVEREQPGQNETPDPDDKNNDSRNDFKHPSKKRRRKLDTKARLKARNDLFDSPNIIEGITGVENDHPHDYVIFNIESGEGWTGPGGLDNHSHRIEGGTVQPFEGKDGTTHMHTLPKVK